MKKDSLIYVAVHEGFIGSAIGGKLKEKGYGNIILRKKNELNLSDQKAVDSFFKKTRPEYVFFPPVRTGGILGNSKYPADFIYQNLISQVNVIYSSFKYGVKKLLFLASACCYPKICPQPIKENYLLTGLLESTSEPYAVAKIVGIKMCQAYNKQYKANFISVIPTNIYGPGDDFREEGHVMAGLIKKFYEAGKEGENSEVRIWGTGKPKREFIYVDDAAEACLFLMNNYNNSELINIAGGEEVSVKKLAGLLGKISGFKGKIIYETEKPDGMLHRKLNSKKIFSLGWRPKVKLKQGLESTCQFYKKVFKIENN